MSLYYLAHFNDDPYIACKYGIDDHPLYRKCAECPRAADCELLAYHQGEQLADKLLSEYHAKSLENKLLYYQDGGHWHAGDWRSVKKDSMWPEDMRKFCCYTGQASHPKYFQCSNCKEYPDCELGKIIKHPRPVVNNDDKPKPSTAQELAELWASMKDCFSSIAELFAAIFGGFINFLFGKKK